MAIGALAWERLLPTSWWFSAGEMRVEDTVVGGDPVLHFDRTIRREFVADWQVKVVRLSDADLGSARSAGGVVTLPQCDGHGRTTYLPEAVLPEPLTLSWWAGRHCFLPSPGEYQIITTWAIDLGSGAVKTAQVRSETFTVRPAE